MMLARKAAIEGPRALIRVATPARVGRRPATITTTSIWSDRRGWGSRRSFAGRLYYVN